MKKRKKFLANLKRIKLVLSDCDGVLTDGGLYYLNDGTEMRRFHVLDGVGFLNLKRNGIKTGIITGDVTDIVDYRAKKLKVDYFYKGSLDKLSVIKEIAKQENIELSQIAYIADDIYDIEALDTVGFSCVPCTASPFIKKHAHYITKKGGGAGCFREVADMILESRQI